MKPKLFEQNEARRLRANGFSVKEIAKELKVSKGSISTWVRSVPLGKSQKQRLIAREFWGGVKGREKIVQQWRDYHLLHPKSIKKLKGWPQRRVETFFDTWNPEMAYVLGYFAADGHMFKNKNGSCYMVFTSSDQELLIDVKEILGVTNSIEKHILPNKNWKTKYVIQIGSKIIYKRLLELGFTPNKSLTLNFPVIPDNVVNHFIRGYFDGDGCASFSQRIRKDRKNKRYKQLVAIFTSGSYKFLDVLRKKLISLGNIGEGGLHRKQKGSYDLVYSTQDVVKLFRFIYPSEDIPRLRRKWYILKSGMEQLGS